MVDSILIFTTVLLPSVSSILLNNSLDACPDQRIRFVCLVNSPQLIWSSNEYIGPSNIIEFSYIDDVSSTKMHWKQWLHYLVSME